MRLKKKEDDAIKKGTTFEARIFREANQVSDPLLKIQMNEKKKSFI